MVSATAQDVMHQNKPLPPHLLEHYCMPEVKKIPPPAEEEIWNLMHLLEVYMDDFIGLLQAPTHIKLEHFTWAVLYSIHKVFPLQD